jgi:S1-C subfamily serine protease
VTKRRSHASRLLWAVTVALTLVSCSGWRHGYTVNQFQGQILRVKGGGPGAERLRIERDYDASVRNFVVQYGEPDYLFVGDRFSLNLIYLDANRVAAFRRSTFNARSDLTVGEVSTALLPYLEPSERARLEHARTAPGIAPPAAPSAPAARQALPGVVRIETPTSLGSGFFVTPDLIATNAHVLAGVRSASVSSGENGGVVASVVYTNPNLDFAVLQSPVKGEPLPIRTSPVTDGEGVVALGFPQGRDVVAASTGTVRGLIEAVIIHDAMVAGGSSGGPLLDSKGYVLGVNTILTKLEGDSTNVTDRVLAVKITTILKSLVSR